MLFTLPDSKISGFTRPHVIGFVADLFFSSLESGFVFFQISCRIRRIRIRKQKVADSKISGYVWTGPKRVNWVYFLETQTKILNNSTRFKVGYNKITGLYFLSGRTDMVMRRVTKMQFTRVFVVTLRVCIKYLKSNVL